jgi:hydrogenase expression/formation protein HypD
MKYVEEYRDPVKVRRLADLINAEATRPVYQIMEVCGTHTAAIHKFGIRQMLTPKIRLISGPGCPVCVTSDAYLKNALELSRGKNRIIATYADMVRVPVGAGSLEKERSCGAAVHDVNSALEALDLARRHPKNEVIFLAVGFETTAPGSALAVEGAQKEHLKNFSIYSAHKTIPEALRTLGKDKDLSLDGFLLPGHVSAIIGVSGYRPVMKKLRLAACVAGFEPLDILLSVFKIVKAVNAGTPLLENEYARIVKEKGNERAKELLKRVFEPRDSVWRGLGILKKSGLFLRRSYIDFDAQKKFGLQDESRDQGLTRGCRCADVLKGKIMPSACPLFAKGCTPEAPQGPCMVSREGTCRSAYEVRS